MKKSFAIAWIVLAFGFAGLQLSAQITPGGGPSIPGGGGSGTNDGSGYSGSSYTIPDYGTNLWLEPTNVSSGRVSGLIHNSVPLIPYTLFSMQSLPWPAWSTETTFYGSDTTNSTVFSLPVLERGRLFLRARSLVAPRIIGAGISHNVAIRRDGTVWAWGANGSGQLGNGQWDNANTPVQVTGLSNIAAVTAPPDGNFTLALDSLGRVWSWGEGGSGQLGHGDGFYVNTNLAAQVPGISNIVAITGGMEHSIALKSDGTVWAWGFGGYGELGDGTDSSRDYPAQVYGLTNAIGIASGSDHNFALCADGTVWGWGYNEDGELGIGNTTDQFYPVRVGSLTNAIALGGGYDQSIALLANGTVKAWGPDATGETGDINSSLPVSVSGLSNIIAIACGGYHNLFLNPNGSLYVWGNDSWNQLGDNGQDTSSAPFLLTCVSNVTAIAGGEKSSMISTADGSIYVWGSSGSGQSALPVLVDLYTNYSTDDSGLPDWWQMLYFGHLGVDPNGDPDGDGRSNLMEYQDGTNPTDFDTPPTPDGLTVTQSTGSTNVTVTWNASSLPVSYYVIYRTDYNYTTWQYGTAQAIGEVSGTNTTSHIVAKVKALAVKPMDTSANVLTFVDHGSVSGGDGNSVYTVQAVYPGGSSPVSAQAYVNATTPDALATPLAITVNLVRNETGRWQLMFADLPSDVQTIRLNWTDDNNNTVAQDIAAGTLTNGIYRIPDTDVIYVLGNTVMVQAIATNGTASPLVQAGTIPNDAPYFVDGRQHMKQNLNFMIRGASQTKPFFAEITSARYFFWDDVAIFYDSYEGGMNQNANDFEEFSFLHHVSENVGSEEDMYYFQLDNLWPFTINYDLADYFVDVTRTNLPFGSTNFNFEPDFTTNIPAPAILDHADPYWILQPAFEPSNAVWGVAMPTPTNWAVTVTSTQTVATLAAGSHNLFGLPYLDGCEVDMKQNGFAGSVHSLYQILTPGGSVTANQGYVIGDYASWCPAPTLQLANYYFVPLINPNKNTMNLSGTFDPNQLFHSGQNWVQPYPTPLDDAFSVTNQTPAVMFGSVGQPMILGGWAKYFIEGSSPAKYAYLGQYFVTNAFKVDDNGNLTSTNTGVVSPYGEFFPTEPGPVAMITLPDIDTGLQGTGLVQVISLALDANHDGTIDTTFNGPDTVSSTHPFRFWVNNNYDRWTPDSDDGTNYMDDVASTDTAAYSPYYGESRPDFDYRPYATTREIPCTRDLEDFARLWVCGMTSNVLAALPPGSTVTLNWGDVGNPNSGNPTIDLFQAVDPDGGIGYLTNATIAAQQIIPAYAAYVGRLAPGANLLLKTIYYGSWKGNHYIWCGVTNGTGKLTLTIADANSNVLAQTSTYIQLVDIKQMYERWTVGDNPSVSPTTVAQLATNDLPATLSWPFRYTKPNDNATPYILYVHGWNMETWEKDRFAETAYKRLYWQGYQGRFGEFRWPTGFGFGGWKSVATDPDNFDNSEYQAWQSAQGLLNKLNNLNTQYPGHVYLLAHSMGNVVAGEALRLTGSSQVVNTYVASQAAVSAHTYDATVPNYSFTVNLGGVNVSFGPNTPNIYGNWFAGNSGGGAGQVINFFNANDYALARLHWQLGQLFKPDQGVLKEWRFLDLSLQRQCK
jgi:alpha-tubulin suppressor-like RCC1 family protein